MVTKESLFTKRKEKKRKNRYLQLQNTGNNLVIQQKNDYGIIIILIDYGID